MVGHIFFITGARGVGKKTLKTNLDSMYAQDKKNIKIHNFDEYNALETPNALWRQEQTNYWLAISKNNAKKGISTIICGGIVPLEVRGSSELISDIPIHFGLLYVNRTAHYKKLKKLHLSQKEIKEELNWSSVLEMCVEKEKGLILDVSDMSSENICSECSYWILNCLELKQA